MAGTKNFQRRIYVCAALAFLCIINYFTYYTLLDYGAFFWVISAEISKRKRQRNTFHREFVSFCNGNFGKKK